MNPRTVLRTAYSLAALSLAAACGDDSVRPSIPPSLAVAPESHSIQVGEAHQFTATYRDPSEPDRVAPVIAWSSVDQTIATVDADGLVLGIKAGTTGIVATARGIADTSFVDVERTPARMSIQPIPAMAPGDVIRLNAIIEDTEGAVMGDAVVEWSVSNPLVAVVTREGSLTAQTEGTVTVTAVALPVSAMVEIEVRIPPPPVGCEENALSLAVGETRHFSGGQALSLCLSGMAEYVIVAANPASGSITTDFLGEGIATPDGPPNPGLLPERRLPGAVPDSDPLDLSFERQLRQRERAQLTPGAARSRAAMRALQATIPLVVGDLIPLNASADCLAPEPRTGKVEFIGQRSIIVADTANPPDGLLASDYARFAMIYDTLLHPVVTGHFGEPAGMNGESKVTIFYTRAVNELTPANSDGVVGGFFWSGDLFPVADCAGSNEREMFYLLAADPAGTINGNTRSVAYVERASAATIAHELQHLVNASRRVYVNDALEWEETWLNEGLSHIAEELVFYRTMGYGPGQNLGPAQIGSTERQVDLTVRYAQSNFLRLDRYLSDPRRQGPFQLDDDLATRGAIWQYLRYSLDRLGGDARIPLSNLANSRIAGIANLEAVFGADPRDWFVDDVIALYADDAVSGISPEHTHPSWNFRTVLDWITDGYNLSTRTLEESSATLVRLEGWGTAYVRTSVRASRVGKILIGSETDPPPADLRLVLMRTR